MGGAMQMVALWVTVLLAVLGATSGQQQIPPGRLARGAKQGVVFSESQVSFSALTWGNEARCFALFLNTPSWAHYNINFNLMAGKGMDETCLKANTRWRSIVVGADTLPRPLAVAVGYQLPATVSNSNYSETARVADMEDVDEGDYDTVEPLMDAAQRTEVFNQASTCLQTAAANTGVDATITALQNQLAIALATNPAVADAIRAQITDLQNTRKGNQNQTLRECLAAIQVSNAPPPPPPPPAPVRQKGKLRKRIADARKKFSLSPFLQQPYHISNSDPNGDSDTPVTSSKSNYQTYEMPPFECSQTFDVDDFKAKSPDTTTAEYDSCYVTQTIIYVYYNGGCNNTNNVTLTDINPLTPNVFINITATYTPFDKCARNQLLALSKAIQILLWATAIPVSCFIVFLIYPTVLRIFYRIWMIFYLLCLGMRKDTKRKHQLRLDMDAPFRWRWLLKLKAKPWVMRVSLFRKRLLYACLTIENPNGRHRFLMILTVASVATSVGIIVWRPFTNLILHSNPTNVTLQLDAVTGTTAKLVRYFQISGISVYYGILAWLCLLTNTNKPVPSDVLPDLREVTQQGRMLSPWWIQKTIACTATFVLSFLLLLQAVNITAFLPIIINTPAYAWVVTVQYINITFMVLFQMYDISMIERDVRVAARPGSEPTSHVAYWIEKVFWSWQRMWRPKQALRHFNSLGALEGRRITEMALRGDASVTQKDSGGKILGKKLSVQLDVESQTTFPSSAAANHSTTPMMGPAALRSDSISKNEPGAGNKPADKPANRRQALKLLEKSKKTRKNKLLHWWHGDRSDGLDEGLSIEDIQQRLREDELEEPLNTCQQIKIIWMEAFGEEKLIVTIPGKLVKTADGSYEKEPDVTYTGKSFKFPSWFLASCLVAFYMLVFHYAKSLMFGEKLGYCVVSWSECEITFIRNFATTFSLEQLTGLRVAAQRAIKELMGLQDVQVLVTAVLSGAHIPASLPGLIADAEKLDTVLTPGNSPRAMWVEAYGKKLYTVSTFGFSVGLVLGLITLLKALYSFKAITKRHRLLVLTRRILLSSDQSNKLEPDVVQAAGAMQALSSVMGTAGSMRRRATTMQRMSVVSAMATPPPSARPSPGKGRAPNSRLALTSTGNLPLQSSGRSGPNSGNHTTMTIEGPSGHHIPEDGPWANIHVMQNSSGIVVQPSNQASPGKNQSPLGSPRRRAHGKAVPPEADAGTDDDNEDDKKSVHLSSSDSSDTDNDMGDPKPLKEPDVFDVSSAAAFRALNAQLPNAVFFLGVLLSCMVVQLYSTGILVSAALAFVLHPYFWTGVVATYWPYVVVSIFVIIVNKVLVLRVIGAQYVTDGRKILRPAGWVAFLIIMSVTNLVLGLFIAIVRLVWLVLTSIITVGLLDRTILAVGSGLDMPHNAFLATVFLQDGMGKADARSLRPGATWRATKRWRGAIKHVVRLGPRGFEKLVARNERRAAKAALKPKQPEAAPQKTPWWKPASFTFSGPPATAGTPSGVALIPDGWGGTQAAQSSAFYAPPGSAQPGSYIPPGTGQQPPSPFSAPFRRQYSPAKNTMNP